MFSIDQLNYSTLEKAEVFKSSEVTELYNEVYRYWKKTWQKILLDAGSPQTWSADDFFRQNFINVVTYKNEIIAVNCSTIFNLKSACAHETKYFSIFNPKVYDWLKKNRVENLMTMEFLSVAKKWRKPAIGISFAEVLIGLGARLMNEKKICAAMGVSVKAAKITQKSSHFNYELVTDDVERGRLPCDIICLNASNVLRHKDEKTASLIDMLWNSRNKLVKSELDIIAA